MPLPKGYVERDGAGMTLNGPETLFYTLAFVVPGFIIHSVIAILFPVGEEKLRFALLRFLAFSCLNYGLWIWLIYILIFSDSLQQHPFWSATLWCLVVFVGPVFLGLAVGKLSQMQVLRRMLHRLRFRTSHPIPTAWDYKFYKTREARCIIVTMKDGSQVAGMFGWNSFASDAASGCDIYLEEVFTMPRNGPWRRRNNSDGIWIAGDEIKAIEFRKNR